MPLVKHDDMVEHVTADAADHALDRGVLPRTPRGNPNTSSIPMLPYPLPEMLHQIYYGGSIAQQIPGAGIPRKGIHHLLGRPLRGGMLGDVDMHDPSPFMRQDHQDKEHLERHGRHHKEIHGGHVPDMIVQEGLPRRRRWRLWSHPICLHGRFGHVRCPASVIPRRSVVHPKSDLLCHIVRDESADLLGQSLARPGLPRWLNRLQCSRNCFRCQATTLRGWTKASAPCHPDHTQASQNQSSRSVGWMRGLGTDRG